MSTSPKILQLRQLLAERHGIGQLAASPNFSTGLDSLDEIGIPSAALTEVVSPPKAGPGGSLLLYGVLHASLQKGGRVILIDGKDSFPPQELSASERNRLLWLRCGQAWEVIKAADLVVRDGNVPLIILFLTLNPLEELRRIPATAWHRLQMLAEKSGVTVLIFTPVAFIGCARLRISVSGTFSPGSLAQERQKLQARLQLGITRRHSRGTSDHEELRRVACA